MVTLAPVAISAQSAKPTYAYGQLANIPLSTTASMLVRVGLPAAVSETAVISSATLVFTQSVASTGTTTVTLRRNTSAFNVSRTTWDTRPAVTGTTVTVSKASPAVGTLWSFDVTSDVQAFASGTAVNYGWRLAGTAGSTKFKGSGAATGMPTLVIEYVEPGEAPEDLHPNGIVSIEKPVLSFLVAPDTTAVQVQVATDVVTVDFDSGEIATDVGQVDLATTAFGGLTAGATAKLWRARSRGATGLTAWSEWASVQRIAKPTVTITSPTGTADDTSPPILWSVSGGTQESWRVVVTNSAGVTKADSGRVTSADTTWTAPNDLITLEGGAGGITVYIWDNVDREVTTGDPDYATDVETYTLSTTSGVTAAASTTASNDGTFPGVEIEATAAVAPDGWSIIRDGEVIHTDMTPGLGFVYNDLTASPNHEHVYRAARVVGGVRSHGGPTATITPRCKGVWLIDPETGDAVVIWGTDSGSWSAEERAVIHVPLAGPPIRRVAYRGPMAGSFSGELVDVGDYTADASIETLYDFKSSEATRLLHLVIGDRSIPVNVGDIVVTPTPLSGTERLSRVSFTWWQVDDIPWDA